MKIKEISAVQVFAPYAAPVGPYVGRGGSPGGLGATGLIFKAVSDEGLVGWGEGTGEPPAGIESLLVGHHVADIEAALASMEEADVDRGPMSGVEMALWDLLGKKARLPICRLFGGVVRDEVDFCGCMGFKEPAQSAATAREYIERWGFRFIKTKAGNDPEQDLSIAAAIQEEIGNEAALRPDANCGYGPDAAEETMRRMVELNVRLFEDPCSSEHLETLVRIRRDIGMTVLVNMGVGTPDSVTEVLEAGAAGMLMPDTPAAGGLLRVKKVAETAAAWGIPTLMHCSHDLGLKTAAITHVAASTPGFSGPSDTCYHGLVDDILSEPLRFKGGRLRVPMGPGLGVDVDEGKIEKYRKS